MNGADLGHPFFMLCLIEPDQASHENDSIQIETKNVQRFFENTDQLLNTMNQIRPNILNLIEMKKLKELNKKLENHDESIFEVKGIIFDALAAKVI